MGHPAPLDLGRRAYLKAKAVGESSMPEKARRREAIKRRVRRGPDGMVKPTLVEPQCPICKETRPGMMVETWRYPNANGAKTLADGGPLLGAAARDALRGSKAAYSRREDMKGAPNPSWQRQPRAEREIP